MLLGVAVEASRLDMFDDIYGRRQSDRELSAEEAEEVAKVRARLPAAAAVRLEELRAHSRREFDVDADDLLEVLGVPEPELGGV